MTRSGLAPIRTYDRIIVAHASLQDATLISKDATVRANYRGALW